MPRYRAIRRLGLAGALALLALVGTQVVLAAPPSGDFTISDPVPQINQAVTFTSTGVSDTDPNDPVTVTWNFGDGQTGSGNSVSHSYTSHGPKTVTMTLTDSANDPAGVETTTVTHTLRVNAAPAAAFNFAPAGEAAGAVADVGQTVNFDASGSGDSDGTITRYEWDLDGNGSFETNSDGPTVSRSYQAPGTVNVKLRVIDSDGATSGVANRNVVVNAPPIANINILNEQREDGQKRTVPLAGQRFVFTARALPAISGEPPASGCPAVGATPASPGSSDPGGSIATYQWDFDHNGTFAVDATGQDVVVNGYPAGQRTVALRVIDNDGGSTTTTLTFRVNAAPTAQFVYEPSYPTIGQQVTFGSTSSDPDPADAGKLTYSWDLDNDGTFCEAGETGASVKRAFPTANDNPGHPVTLRVTDDGGITRPAIRNVIVQNTVPTGSISFSPDAPLPGQPVTFTGSASSPTGKAIARMEWDFNFDRSSGQFDVEATGASVSRAFPTPGPKTVALRIHEAGGGTAIDPPEGVTVIVNAPPQAGFHVAPETAFVGDTVTLSSTSFDSDGSSPPRQEWDLDNDGQFDDANAAVVSARFGRAGTYPLKLRVTDSRGASSTATGRVIVQNRPVPPLQVLSGVEINARFLVFPRRTKLHFLRVRAPTNSMISVRCLGKGCPKRVTKRSKGSKVLHFKKLQRMYRPKTKLIVSVTKSGFIGKQTSWTIRRRKPPIKRSLCLNPGAKKATACPSG